LPASGIGTELAGTGDGLAPLTRHATDAFRASGTTAVVGLNFPFGKKTGAPAPDAKVGARSGDAIGASCFKTGCGPISADASVGAVRGDSIAIPSEAAGKLPDKKSATGIGRVAEFAVHTPAEGTVIVVVSAAGVAPVSIWANAAGSPALSPASGGKLGAPEPPVAAAKAARGESMDVAGAESCMNKNPPWRTTAPIRGAGKMTKLGRGRRLGRFHQPKLF
jgi:hypothetical protein